MNVWKWKTNKKTKTRALCVCGVSCTGEYVFSWDIWLHQLEFLYCCCNKCLYSHFTSFCFSVLLDCSLASLFNPCLFLSFLFITAKTFSLLFTHLYMCKYTQAQSLTKLKTRIIHSTSKWKFSTYPDIKFQHMFIYDTLNDPWCFLCFFYFCFYFMTRQC